MAELLCTKARGGGASVVLRSSGWKECSEGEWGAEREAKGGMGRGGVSEVTM